ncbi:MAG: type VI secretion system tip protein VgrG [Planctomycetes bacterium]|nr:type VI secretion system tip protein VgrG [Planctomycetota bacterium]
MTDLANQSIAFEVEGFAKNTLVVTRLAGQEGLSQLWEFELELVSRDKSLDLQKVLYSPVRLGFKQGIIVGGEKALRTRWFAGLLAEFQQQEQGQGWVTYRARMVPKLWLAKEFWRSRIFLDKDIKGLVSSVLTGDSKLTEGEDFKLSLERGGGGGKDADVYPEHEYVVQYEETDFAFLSRWLEHEGVFYFFDNEGQKEEVLFADSTAAYRDSRETIPYRPSSTAGSEEGGENTLYEEEVVRNFLCKAGRLPKRVILKDYNWRTPEVELSVVEQVKDDGVGQQTEFNDHYKTEGQGKTLAAVRKEELACRSTVYLATSNCKALRPGKTFKLTEHYREDFNTTYLVTAVSHSAEQSVDLDGGKVSSGSYSNALTLIPAEVSFRPRRTTEWPSIKGVMHAKVDAPDTEGDYAEIDDYGRYRIVFPYDESVDKNNDNKRQSGPASRYVRMLQPYAGRESGMHFPLLKGTDVMVTHLDGDPDRPVIVGAVPNPDTMSPVTSANYMSNKIVTTSGNTMEFDDNPDCPGMIFYDATRSVIEDNRFPVTSGGGGGGGGNPGGGSGGVKLPPMNKRAQPKLRPRRGSEPTQPGAGQGTVAPVTPPTSFEAWSEFVNGAAFAQAGSDGSMIAGLPLTEGNLKKAVNQLLRKHLTHGSSPAGAGDMGALMAGMGNEMVDMIATPFGLGSPNSGAVDDYLSDLATGGKQAYSVGSEKFQVNIGDNTKVWIGNAKYTFDDVSNSVNFGTGGYGYSRTDGDSFSESYQYGKDYSVSIFYGEKDSFSMSMSKSHSASMEMSASESESIKIGASNDVSLFIGGESSIKFEASYKNSMALWAGLITDINIYASATFALELGAVAELKIEIVPDKYKLKLPKSTEITVQDLKVKLDETNVKLNNTSTNMMKTNIAMSETKTALAKTQTELAETKTALQKTQTELSETKTALTETKTELSETTTALSKSQSLLSNDVKALVFNSTAGITKL